MPQRRENFLGLFLSNLAPGLNQLAQMGIQQQMFRAAQEERQQGQLEQFLVRNGLDPSLASDPASAATAIQQLQQQQSAADQAADLRESQMGQFDDFLGADPMEQAQRASAMQATENPMAGLALAQVGNLPFQQDTQTGEISRPQVSQMSGLPMQEIRQTAKQPIPPLPGREDFLRQRNLQNIAAESRAARQGPSEVAANERARLGVQEEFVEDDPAAVSGPQTEGQRRAAAFAQAAEGALRSAEELESRALSSSFLWRSNLTPNIVRDPAFQEYIANLDNFARNVVIAKSGAQFSAQELEQTRKALVPQIGDTQETIAAKRRLRRQELNSIRVAAGLEPLPFEEDAGAGVAGGGQQFRWNPATGQLEPVGGQ